MAKSVPLFCVGEKVRTRMLGVEVESKVAAIRDAKRRLEYQIAIPEGIEERIGPTSDRERAYIRRSRDDGGFWFFGTSLHRVSVERDGKAGD